MFDALKEVSPFLIGAFIKLLILLVTPWKLSAVRRICSGKALLLFWIIVKALDLSIVLLRFLELATPWFSSWFLEGKLTLLSSGLLPSSGWADKPVVFVAFCTLRSAFGLTTDPPNGWGTLTLDDVGRK